jgi:carbonic anhydrase
LATPITLDYQQLAQYEKVAGDSGFLPNNRPIQPTNGRQMNQFNIDLNFQGQSIGGNNFTFARAHPSSGPNLSIETAALTTPAASASPLVPQTSGFGATMRTG